MTRHFCTYFDKNFLLRGLALHQSLAQHCPDFKLWILCMDEESYTTLDTMALEKVELIRLADFEDDELRQAKKNRSLVEYFWTCTPSLPLYVFKKSSIDTIAYLDADLYFYSSLEPIYQEIGDASITIIPHRFSEEQVHKEKIRATYNVGMLVFKNTTEGISCLTWWRERCLEWCFDRYEDGKFGDQMYLNDWPTRFKEVCVLEHHGANIGSWNVRRYAFDIKGEHLQGTETKTGTSFPVIFYHFHGVILYRIFGRVYGRFGSVRPDVTRLIYTPYFQALNTSLQRIERVFNSRWVYGFNTHIFRYFFHIVRKRLTK